MNESDELKIDNDAKATVVTVPIVIKVDGWVKGDVGPRGETGEPGPAGEKGQKGDTGATGASGGAGTPSLLVESGASAKISALPAAGALDGTELTVLVQAGADVQSTTADISSSLAYTTGQKVVIGDDIYWATGQVAIQYSSGFIFSRGGQPVIAPGGDLYLNASLVDNVASAGTNGQVLTNASGLPVWGPVPYSDLAPVVSGFNILWNTGGVFINGTTGDILSQIGSNVVIDANGKIFHAGGTHAIDTGSYFAGSLPGSAIIYPDGSIYLPSSLSDSTGTQGPIGSVLTSAAGGTTLWATGLTLQEFAIDGETGNSSNVTTLAADGMHEIAVYLTIVSITASALVVTVAWTDETGTARTVTLTPLIGALNAAGAVQFAGFSFRNQNAGDTVTVTVTLVGTTVVFNYGAMIIS